MVPKKIAIPLLILFPIVIWILGTRKYNFMEPKPLSAEEIRPDFAAPPNRELVKSLSPFGDPPPEVPTPTIPRIELGDNFVSPSLSEYQADSHLGAPSLLQLGEELLAKEDQVRALLAYERILDSTPTGGKGATQAETAITKIKTKLPPWNPDPATRLALQVHLSSARDPSEFEAIASVITEISNSSSGHLCETQCVVETSPAPSQELPSLPIAIWITVPGEDPGKPSLSAVTIVPGPDENLDEKILQGLYRLLTTRAKMVGGLTPPSPLLRGEKATDSILFRITRLTWEKILNSPFQSLEQGPPSDGESLPQIVNPEEPSDTIPSPD